MEDVERDVTRLPPQFVAHGVDYEGGIYNKPMEAGFTYADVDAAMDGATVVMLNAGFVRGAGKRLFTRSCFSAI